LSEKEVFLTASYSEPSALKLTRLRDVIQQARIEMLKAEADLTQRLAEATAFEEVLRARLSPLSDQLDGLEKEVRYYDEQLQKSKCV
jgi:polyhydroxyalkanoate synthesis regulator phasin